MLDLNVLHRERLMSALQSARLCASAFGQAYIVKTNVGTMFVTPGPTHPDMGPKPWTVQCIVRDDGEVEDYVGF